MAIRIVYGPVKEPRAGPLCRQGKMSGSDAWSRQFDRGYSAHYWYNRLTGASVWEASLDQEDFRALREEIYGAGTNAADESNDKGDQFSSTDETGDYDDNDDGDDDDDDDDDELDAKQEQSFHTYLQSEEGKHEMEMELRELEKKFYRRKEIALERRRFKIERRKMKYSKSSSSSSSSVIIGLEDMEVGAGGREIGVLDDDIDSISTGDTNVQEAMAPNFPSFLQWRPLSKIILRKTGMYLPGDANALYDDFSFRNFVLLSVFVMKNMFLALVNGALASLALVRTVGDGMLAVFLATWASMRATAN